MKRRSRLTPGRSLARWRSVAVLGMLSGMVGCAQQPLDGTGSEQAPGQSATPGDPSLVRSSPHALAAQRRLVRLLAQALADPSLRVRVYEAMQASPYKEHKLDFRRFLERDGLPIQQAMARLEGTPQSELLATLGGLPEFEFYMPVREHFAAWAGGANLIVVGRLGEQEDPVGFDLTGAPVRELSATVPPRTPALVVVPIESLFDKDVEPGTAPRPAFAVAKPSPTSPWDFRLAEVNIGKSFDPWTSGEPEFEIHVYASTAAGDPLAYANGSLAFWQCIGEDQLAPASRWNYDAWGSYRTYTGTARPVLATDIGQNALQHGQMHLWVIENDNTAPCNGSGDPTRFPIMHWDNPLSDDNVLKYSMPYGLQSLSLQYLADVNRLVFNFGLRANAN
jgi:hypothetical protein